MVMLNLIYYVMLIICLGDAKNRKTTTVVNFTEFGSLELNSSLTVSTRDHLKCGSRTDFFGKVILVTGASSGVGKVIATHFAKLGASLSLAGRNFTKLYHTYKHIKKYATVTPQMSPGDISKPLEADFVVQCTTKRFGRLDVLVNNAGIYEFGGIKNTSVDQLQRVFDNNVKSMYAITREAVPYLEKTNGTIINVSSLAGLRPFPGILAYCMSKAAVDQFTKCLALELGPRIRVNSVNPSVVDTGIHLKAGMEEEKYRKYIEGSKAKHILGRITTEKDVARAVTFLASDKASFITGVNFPVDGGRSIMCP